MLANKLRQLLYIYKASSIKAFRSLDNLEFGPLDNLESDKGDISCP